MTIEEEDFKLSSETGKFWDLELLEIIKPKGKPERHEFKIIGYGMTMDNCFKRIIHYRMSKSKEVYTLKEYFDSFIRHKQELEYLLKDY